MMKCPFCQFDNEDGALFCEQCKSDLGFAAEAAPVAAAPMAEPMAFGDPVPMAAVAEAVPAMDEVPMAGLAVAEAAPLAEAQPFDPFAETATPSAPPPMAEASPFEQAGFSAPAAEAVPVMPDLPTEAMPAIAEAMPAVAEAVPMVAEAAPLEAAPAAVPAVSVTAPAVTTPPPAAAPAPAAPGAPGAIPAGANPRLVVMRGLKINVEYPLYEGMNFIGRADEKPVDVDLEDQEPPDRIWSSRQHALITYEDGVLQIEDLNSSNGTFVNRNRIYPGQKRPLSANDVVQIGTVQMKLKL
jgi:hypothetical protein